MAVRYSINSSSAETVRPRIAGYVIPAIGPSNVNTDPRCLLSLIDWIEGNRSGLPDLPANRTFIVLAQDIVKRFRHQGLQADPVPARASVQCQ